MGKRICSRCNSDPAIPQQPMCLGCLEDMQMAEGYERCNGCHDLYPPSELFGTNPKLWLCQGCDMVAKEIEEEAYRQYLEGRNG